MELNDKTIPKCRFCGKNIKDSFTVRGLIIICPFCNKPNGNYKMGIMDGKEDEKK